MSELNLRISHLIANILHYVSFQLKIAQNKFVDQNRIFKYDIWAHLPHSLPSWSTMPLSFLFSPVPGATGNGILWTNERREDICVTNQRPVLREVSSEDLLGPGQADNSWELAP